MTFHCLFRLKRRVVKSKVVEESLWLWVGTGEESGAVINCLGIWNFPIKHT